MISNEYSHSEGDTYSTSRGISISITTPATRVYCGPREHVHRAVLEDAVDDLWVVLELCRPLITEDVTWLTAEIDMLIDAARQRHAEE